ncbi:MAG: endolytic transglycosylase MltG [Patescibacteria group bacterium]
MKRSLKYFLLLLVIVLIIILGVRVINRGNKANQEPKIIYKPETTVKILEGWNNREIGQYLAGLGPWPAQEFLTIVGSPQVDYRQAKGQTLPTDFSEQFSFLKDKPEYYGLEGYLFPDTYRVYATSTTREVVEKILANFDKKLTSTMRADIEKQGKTIYEIVTLASIIEKEAPLNYAADDNREARIISGIFWNRLKIGQALQSDATLSYIFGDNNPQHSGRELENDSLYNTYKYRGLPPGPICNPGLLAIEAAIYPLLTDYNYFLTPTDSREVIFSKTYTEHLQNKYKYLK